MRSGPTGPAILDALGDPIRRVMYQRLARGPLDVSTLAKGLPVTRSAVSHHLRVLRECRLVAVEADGRRWHSRRRDFENDRRRDHIALVHDYRTLRFTHRQLEHEPSYVLEVLLAVGALTGARAAP